MTTASTRKVSQTASEQMEDRSEEEELKQLRELTTEDEEEEEEFVDDLRGNRQRRKFARGSTSASLFSRKNTLLSITQSLLGFELDDDDGHHSRGQVVVPSSDEDSSASSQAVGDWNEQQIASPELPQEYWQVQRLVKYIKVIANMFAHCILYT